MKLVLTGGGTGGHVYPALAIAEAFAAEPAFAPLDVLFVGTRDRLEARIVPAAGVPIAFVHAAPFLRELSCALFSTIAANLQGIVDSLGVLHRARPDVVIATGGYVAFPLVAALRLVRLLRRTKAKVAVLETNASRGLTNALLAPLADEVWYASAPEHRKLARKEAVVGTPVRESMRRPLDRADARRALGLDAAKSTVVVMGGSQGARRLSEAALALADAGLPTGLQLLLLTGDDEYARFAARARDGVRVLAYLEDPRTAYAAADLVVARAGASTLGELAATATPALLVPYPHATADHQTHNARAFARAGFVRILADADVDGPRLRTEIASALEPAALAAMRAAARATSAQDAAAAIVARVKRWSPANAATP